MEANLSHQDQRLGARPHCFISDNFGKRMELGLHFTRAFERRIVFVVDAHESRRDVRRLNPARPPSILATKRGAKEFVQRL